MSKISYRLAQPGDEIQLADLHFLAFKDSVGYTFPFPKFLEYKEHFAAADEKRYADHIAKQEAFLACDGEKIVGCAMWRLPVNGETQHGLDTVDDRISGIPDDAVDAYHQQIKKEEILKRRVRAFCFWSCSSVDHRERFYLPNHIMRKELMVHPSYQGKRIATRLLEQVHAIALQRGLSILVRAYQGSAALHKKMGYKTLASWKIEDDRPGKQEGYVNCVQVLDLGQIQSPGR